MIDIHTDGSCLGNPGPGGWAAISDNTDGVGPTFKVCGGDLHTTNNIMELRGALEGLTKAFELGHREVRVFTDSNYVKMGMTQWIQGWERKGWTTASGGEVKNQELWKKLLALSRKFLNVQWEWVKAHNGDPMNEAVDTLARKTAELIKSV